MVLRTASCIPRVASEKRQPARRGVRAADQGACRPVSCQLRVAARAVRPSVIAVKAFETLYVLAWPAVTAGRPRPVAVTRFRPARMGPAGPSAGPCPSGTGAAGPGTVGTTTAGARASGPAAVAGPGPPGATPVGMPLPRFGLGLIQPQQGGGDVGQTGGHEAQQETAPVRWRPFRFIDSVLHSFMLVHDSLLSWSIAELSCQPCCQRTAATALVSVSAACAASMRRVPPAAFRCPPPPNAAAAARTSVSPKERRLNLWMPARPRAAGRPPARRQGGASVPQSLPGLPWLLHSSVNHPTERHKRQEFRRSKVVCAA